MHSEFCLDSVSHTQKTNGLLTRDARFLVLYPGNITHNHDTTPSHDTRATARSTAQQSSRPRARHAAKRPALPATRPQRTEARPKRSQQQQQ